MSGTSPGGNAVSSEGRIEMADDEDPMSDKSRCRRMQRLVGEYESEKEYGKAAEVVIEADRYGCGWADQEYFRFDMDNKKKMVVSADRLAVTEKAAEMGYPIAMFVIGARYRTGVMYEKNYDKAFEWFSKAAEKGNAEAIYYLGKMYEKGRAVEQDPATGLKYIMRAARIGNRVAIGDMARRYASGRTV